MEDRSVLRRATDFFNRLEEIFLFVTIAGSVIIIFMQIVMRYVFNNSLSWSEELARYLFIWFSWLGISIGQRKGEHIVITMLTDRLRGIALTAVLLLKDLVTLGILVVLIYYGAVVVMKQLDMGIVSVALKVPMDVIYASMPVGCFCMAVRLAFRRVRGASAPENNIMQK